MPFNITSIILKIYRTVDNKFTIRYDSLRLGNINYFDKSQKLIPKGCTISIESYLILLPSILLISIYGYASFLSFIFHKKPSVALFLSISFISTILFIFGMFDFLKYGSYILFYGGSCLLIYTVFKYKERIIVWFLSIPIVIYTVTSFTYLLLMHDVHFFFWDEYSHWGIFIKEMYYFNTFYDASSLAAHLNYPPGISVWSYFIISNTFFSEGNVYFAYFLILFSSTLMMYENLKWKDIHWIILIFLVQMVLFASFGHWFSSIYVDHVIGALFAGLVLSYLVDSFSEKSLFLFLFPLLFIVLIKEIGLYFGLCFLGLILILNIKRSGLLFWNSIKQNKNIFLIAGGLFLSMFLVLQFWSMRQASLGIQKETQTISSIVKMLLSSDSILDNSTAKEVKKRFWEVVLKQQLHQEQLSLNYNEFSYGIMPLFKKNIKLTTASILLFFIFFAILINFSVPSKTKKHEFYLIFSYLIIIYLVYIGIIYASYLVAFGNDALRLPSYDRYLNMMTLPILFILFIFLFPYLKDEYTISKKIFFLASLAFIILVAIVQPYIKPLYSQLESPINQEISKISKILLSKIPPQSKLFVVLAPKGNGHIDNVLKYTLIPIKTTINNNKFLSDSFEEMIVEYQKYDYIWFASQSPQIFEKNKLILQNDSQGRFAMLYKLEHKINGIQFIPIF